MSVVFVSCVFAAHPASAHMSVHVRGSEADIASSAVLVPTPRLGTASASVAPPAAAAPVVSAPLAVPTATTSSVAAPSGDGSMTGAWDGAAAKPADPFGEVRCCVGP